MLECALVARVVFMGTPEFAVPVLRALTHAHAVVGVVTQPDRSGGRGKKLTASPVKAFAQQTGLSIIQPNQLREPEAMAQLTAWAPDLIVAAAFGQLLRPAVLGLPPRGCLNVHASLLPRYRGASPIAAAILAGEAETGVTIMKMDEGLDTGPTLARRAEPIRPDDTTQTLSERLAEVGAALLVEILPGYLTGQITPQPQEGAFATFAPQLKKEDGHLDFTRPAVELERRVRAFTPWPGAFALWKDQPLKILRATLLENARGEPGLIMPTEHGPAVACGAGALALSHIQPPGKKPMAGADFARGARGFIGAKLA